MAESFFKTNPEANDLQQDDPFAELTRIMGHDPRSNVSLRPRTPEVAEGLALDLENELMGDLDQDEPGENHVQTSAIGADLADWRYSLAEAAGGDADFERSLDALLDGTLDEQASGEHPSFDQDTQSAGYSSVPNPGEQERSFRSDDGGQEPNSAEESLPFDYARAAAERPQFLSGATIEPARETGFSPYTTAWSASSSWDDQQAAEEPAPAADHWAADSADSYDDEPQDRWNHAESHRQDFGGESYNSSSVSYSNYHQPEIETIEVAETAVAVAAPLDIPEVPYREEVKPTSDLDEIEEILAGAFGEMAEQPEPQVEVAQQPQEEQHSDRFIDDEFLMAGIAAGIGTTAALAREAPDSIQEWSSRYDDPAQLTPMPGVQPPAASSRLRLNPRLLMSAAVIGGVAILGGVAFFAFSSGGTGEPVLLSADNSPIKVRPENPGGVQIPNQENPVYKRVAGEQTDAPSEQPRLVSATEEPLALPLPDDGEFDDSNASVEDTAPTTTASATPNSADTDRAAAAPGGSEERLTNTGMENPVEKELVAVTPRRVRTLVVRPDGSMVPAELPQVAQAEPATMATDAIASASAAAADQPARAEARDDTPAVPRTGPIPPSRPGNITPEQPQQVAALTPQPQQPAAQPAAEAPQPQQVAALQNEPAANASEWSVQIASQPSVEDAQKSYQQLAQRYGNVLQGKGVNIVKADIEGKGTYYRVRIPSSSKESAIELCSQLKSAGGTCFVSK